MSMVLFDRFLFAFTIGSHIVLVTMSISLIFLIAILEFLFLTKKSAGYSELIRRLKKVFVISFGVGTASGIVMAVELINLFPGFMTVVSKTGAINLLYAEVFAFFIETIALVIYVYFEGVYRWKYTNILLSFVILFGALLSAVLITMLNAWMNTPNGFNTFQFAQTGVVSGIYPWAPFLTPSTLSELAHMLSTTIFAGVMVNGAYFAFKYVRNKEAETKILYRTMVRITSVLSIIFVILVGLTGSNEMVSLLTTQPLKYAAFDLNYSPGTNLPEWLFGVIQNGNVVGGYQIPGLQSLIAKLETGKAALPGLSQYPSNLWPPLIVHSLFDVMVVGGLILGLFLFIIFLMFVLKKDILRHRGILYLQILAGILTFSVYEIGWTSDEIGRQPWIIYNAQTVSQASNYSSGLLIPGYLIIAFYFILIPVTFYFFARTFNLKQEKSEEPGKGV